MTDIILQTLIPAGTTLLVCLINNHYQQKEYDKKQNETVGIVTYRLEQLEKKQDLHNNAVSRLYEVERRLEINEERIKVSNHRIDDLEKGRS